MIDLDDAAAQVARRHTALAGERALLVGLSGIDGCGKGFVAARLRDRLEVSGLRVALLNVDGWLNLPSVRFSSADPGGHFYRHALRLDEMFAQPVLPLRDHRALRLVADYAEETATAYRSHLYAFHDVEVVLLEGIFIYKRAHRPHFDLAFWVDCTFETALERALRRAQEGLPPADMRASVDGLIQNDPRLGWAGSARV
jgi:uridine kinase